MLKVTRFMANLILTKSSTEDDLKRYFNAVLELSQSDNEFPINFDEVWMLVYKDKHKAVEDLRDRFLEDVDYQAVTQKVECQNGIGYSRRTDYFLTVSCMEFFIARKVRPVFEIYRRVFHKTAQMRPQLPKNYADALRQLAAQVEQNEKLLNEVEEKRTLIESQQQTIELQENELKESAPKAKFYDNVLQSNRIYTSTVVAKELGLKTAEQLHVILREKNVMFFACGQWVLTAPYCGKGYTRPKTHIYTKSDGSQGTNTITCWTEEGRMFLHTMFDA